MIQEHRLATTALASIGGVLISGLAFAAPPNVPGQPFQALSEQIMDVQDAVDGIESDVSSLANQLIDLSDQVGNVQDDIDTINDALGDINDDVAELSNGVNALSNVLTIHVIADLEICAKLAVQCGSFNNEAESDANDNPFRLLVHVTKNGQPVNGLTIDSFDLNGGFVPPGGAGPSFCDTTDCGNSNFGAAGSGQYQIFIKRAVAGNWKSGAYSAALSAVDGDGAVGSTQVGFEVPEAP